MIFNFLNGQTEQWRTGLLFALGLHLSVLVLALFGPDMLESSRKQEQVYTVKLFEPPRQPVARSAASSPGPAPAPAKPAPRPVHKKILKKPAKPALISGNRRPEGKKPAPAKKTKPVIVPGKLVSLKPVRKKPEKELHKPARKRPEKAIPADKGQSSDELLQRRIAAIQNRVREKEEERRLEQRLRAISQKLEKQQTASKRKAEGDAGNAVSAAPDTAGTINQIIAMYGMEVSQKIWRRWNLPTRLIDQKGLEAIIEIKIAEDGRVLATRFEQSSGNMLFDRSAMRAVKDAAPVPSLPRPLRPGPLVMGIRFRPEDR